MPARQTTATVRAPGLAGEAERAANPRRRPARGDADDGVASGHAGGREVAPAGGLVVLGPLDGLEEGPAPHRPSGRRRATGRCRTSGESRRRRARRAARSSRRPRRTIALPPRAGRRSRRPRRRSPGSPRRRAPERPGRRRTAAEGGRACRSSPRRRDRGEGEADRRRSRAASTGGRIRAPGARARTLPPSRPRISSPGREDAAHGGHGEAPVLETELPDDRAIAARAAPRPPRRGCPSATASPCRAARGVTSGK